MRKITTIILLMISMTMSSQSGLDSIMFSEINKLRTDPESFIPLIREYHDAKKIMLTRLRSGKSTYTVTSGKSTKDNTMSKNTKSIGGIEAIRGDIRAAREVMAILKLMKPVPALIFCETMDSITNAQGEFLDTTGRIGHYGPNRNTLSTRFKGIKPMTSVSENVGPLRKRSISMDFRDIIAELLIDGHVKSRGHRKNLLNPKSKFISIYIGKTCYVQNFLH